jgi:hypothetical protein
MVNRAAGYVVKAATDWNVIVGNFAALWPYSASGQIAISTSAADLTAIAFVRNMGFQINTDAPLLVGDDAIRFRIPASLNGWVISSVAASRKSGTGVPTIQIRNVTDAVDVLSTRITIDTAETDSSTAAVAAVINTLTDDVATADQFAIDIDVAGTTTLYLFVEIGFTRP